MDKSLLRFVTTGSVDDGKSTLIGRLLYETKSVFEDQLAAVERTSKRKGASEADLALLLDGLAAEREQMITIDVAYRYFETARRKFIIADCPGHEQYTRNMVTGASTADCALILIDARSGVLTQSRRHGFLVSLLQIPHLVVVVNKMDLVDYAEDRFRAIAAEYAEFTEKLEIRDITFVPASALRGDNVTAPSSRMPWYSGPTVLSYLEDVHAGGEHNLVDFRFPVQYVLRPHQNFRGFAGRIVSGTVSPGQEVAVLPSGRVSKVSSVVTCDGELPEAFAPQSVAITLADEIDISRGDMIVRRNNLPQVASAFEAMVCWMDSQALEPGRQYVLKHTSRSVRATVSRIHYRVDVNTLHRAPTNTLGLNDIGRVEIETVKPLFIDPYRINRATGSFVLIDPHTNATAGAGMIRGVRRSVEDLTPAQHHTIVRRRSANVSRREPAVPLAEREKRNGHAAAVVWLTGLSGSGKTTIARALERRLFAQGCHTCLLDGDAVRQGLCGDLGFSDADRTENIRRVAEVARLFFESGAIVLCTFISPFAEDRAFARSLVPAGRFVEVFVKCSLDECRRRDPSGLYRKAQAGEIAGFTGVDSPYEAPSAPELTIDTERESAEQAVGRIAGMLSRAGIVPAGLGAAGTGAL